MRERKNIFTNFRDKHGVADLLREVSQRKKCSLTPRDRKEVSEIADRVDQNSGRTIPSETLETRSSEDSNNSTNDASTKSNGSGPVNKWGKDFFQKFSNRQNSNDQDQDQNSQRTPKDFFRNFSIKGIQIPPLKPPQQEASNGENDQRSEIKKTLERSQQSGREMFQNISKNFQNFSNNLKGSLAPPQQSPTATAAAVSDSLCGAAGAHASSDTPSPKGE